jgi:hypothetical protein
MAEYQLTATDVVVRNGDGMNIPNDPGNADRQQYEAWLEDGGVPDPYIKPLDTKPLTIKTAAEILGVA